MDRKRALEQTRFLRRCRRSRPTRGLGRVSVSCKNLLYIFRNMRPNNPSWSNAYFSQMLDPSTVLLYDYLLASLSAVTESTIYQVFSSCCYLGEKRERQILSLVRLPMRNPQDSRFLLNRTAILWVTRPFTRANWSNKNWETASRCSEVLIFLTVTRISVFSCDGSAQVTTSISAVRNRCSADRLVLNARLTVRAKSLPAWIRVFHIRARNSASKWSMREISKGIRNDDK